MRRADLTGRKVALLGLGVDMAATLDAIVESEPGELFAVDVDADRARRLLAEAGLGDVAVFETVGWMPPADVAVRSPGFPLYSADLQDRVTRGMETVTPLGLWLAERGTGPTVALTGTKGKSTVSVLTTLALEHLGRPAVTVGNIGIGPWTLDSVGGRDGGDRGVELPGGRPRVHARRSPPSPRSARTTPTGTARSTGTTATRPGSSPPPPSAAAGGRGCSTTSSCRPRSTTSSSAGFRRPPVGSGPATPTWPRPPPSPSPGRWSTRPGWTDVAAVLLQAYPELPGRFRLAGDGRTRSRYIDDALASNPLGLAASIGEVGPEPLTVIVGGADRGANPEPVVAALARRAGPTTVICIDDAVAHEPQYAAAGAATHQSTDLEHAVRQAARITPAGGIVLFSPGMPTPPAEGNWSHRSARFQAEVDRLRHP